MHFSLETKREEEKNIFNEKKMKRTKYVGNAIVEVGKCKLSYQDKTRRRHRSVRGALTRSLAESHPSYHPSPPKMFCDLVDVVLACAAFKVTSEFLGIS